jgi:hypothetical protein
MKLFSNIATAVLLGYLALPGWSSAARPPLKNKTKGENCDD